MLQEISRTIDRVINGDGPTRWGFMLVVAEIGTENPVSELCYNVTPNSLKAMLREGLAREEGRLVDQGGTA